MTRFVTTRTVLALSGWVALLATLLPAGSPVRVAVTAAFVLLAPGAAAVRPRWPRPREGAVLPALEGAVLTVAVSLALAVAVAEAFYLHHAFTLPRALAVLAAVTTVLALLPRAGDREPGGGQRAPRGRPARRRWWRAGGAGLLLVATGCSGPPAPGLGGGPSTAPVTSPGALGADPAAAGPWHLVFHDDFNGTALDTARWATCYDWNDHGCTNAGNHESEWYLPGQVSVRDGRAVLTAQRRDTVGSDGKTYPWTSGMITTGRDSWNGTPKETFTRGYFEVAMRVPSAGGMFPAFWLMPDTRSAPPELDVAEFPSDPNAVNFNLHWIGPDKSDQHVGLTWGPADFAGSTHVLAADWEQDSVTWYVDGVARWKQTEHVPDVPMELIVNLAVGYPYPPAPDVQQAQATVDWVKVWQH
ncbi:family 16 glycosylhydrolase [Kitasatospora sp. NPDC058965]|uniref:glycoside hydrolase family 16 protein n=1 Tax=Kitasatospora sp. NPDC058965 TaxID=3346682 RepID=UPI003681F9C1